MQYEYGQLGTVSIETQIPRPAQLSGMGRKARRLMVWVEGKFSAFVVQSFKLISQFWLSCGITSSVPPEPRLMIYCALDDLANLFGSRCDTELE